MTYSQKYIEIQEMLKQKIIIPSQSPWCSPMVVVPQPDGSLRICVDFRRLNVMACFDAFPMPHIKEVLEWIDQAKYISTIDLSKRYWQIPMSERDQPKTAHSTPWGF